MALVNGVLSVTGPMACSMLYSGLPVLLGHAHDSNGRCLVDSCADCRQYGCSDGMLYRRQGPDPFDVESDGPCFCSCHRPKVEQTGWIWTDEDYDMEELW